MRCLTGAVPSPLAFFVQARRMALIVLHRWNPSYNVPCSPRMDTKTGKRRKHVYEPPKAALELFAAAAASVEGVAAEAVQD